MHIQHPHSRLALGGLLLACLAAPLVGGCSGSGVTPSVLPPAPFVPTAPVTGTLTATDGKALAGYSVVFDRNSTAFVGTVTNAQGQFTLPVPVTAITGSDTLSVLDPAGGLSAVVPITLTPGSTAPVTLPAITVGPPVPPAGV